MASATPNPRDEVHLQRMEIMESRIIPARSEDTRRCLDIEHAGNDERVSLMIERVGSADLADIAADYWRQSAGLVRKDEELTYTVIQSRSGLSRLSSAAHKHRDARRESQDLLKRAVGLLERSTALNVQLTDAAGDPALSTAVAELRGAVTAISTALHAGRDSGEASA
ncbi:hypothetical protein [Corynebacterium sp. AOP12-C2-36]|uniref:hypothetical protein n=1 Tax=Corynebacterium sp. AOP12-C2-36 TaxID=3457723 RepID=UPI0040340E7C